jgi:cytochrome c553
MNQSFFRQILGSIVITISLLYTSFAFSADDAAENAPKVPFQYALGYQKYQQMCTSCHGQWGQGTRQGPPLMHPFYKPSHHADAAFYRAALNGVKAHHWQFGNMPPVSGVTKQDMDAIVPYIRWLQREKGVY